MTHSQSGYSRGWGDAGREPAHANTPAQKKKMEGHVHSRVFEGCWGVILGGSSGFGLATAHKLAAHGMHLCLVHRDRRATVLDLLSLDEAAWVNGALLRVDSGEHVAGAMS